MAALVALCAAAASGEQGYLIGGGDSLQVNVWKNPELSQTVTVRPNGMITLPLIRDVPASGQTALDLGKMIEARLSVLVNAPNVTVTVVAATNYRVYTHGAVADGMYALTALINALQLLSRAGGPTAGADLASAYILRGFQLGREMRYVGPMFLWNLNFCSVVGVTGEQCFWSLLDPAGNPRRR